METLQPPPFPLEAHLSRLEATGLLPHLLKNPAELQKPTASFLADFIVKAHQHVAAKPPPLGTVTNGQRSRIPQSRKSMLPVPKPVDISDTAEEPEA